MSFSNQSIREPRPGKPHICLRAGRWRVSSWPPYAPSLLAEHWRAAHIFITWKNYKEERA